MTKVIRPDPSGSRMYEFERVDYKNREFSDFYVDTNPGYGPGWYVYGRNPECGGTLIKMCAQPSVSPKLHPHYNGKVRRGWWRKYEAQAVADELNKEVKL